MSEAEGGPNKIATIVAFATLAVTIATLVMFVTQKTGNQRGASVFRRIRLFNGGAKPVNATVTLNSADNMGASSYPTTNVPANGTWIEDRPAGGPLYAQTELVTVSVIYDPAGTPVTTTLNFVDPDGTNTTDCYNEVAIYVQSDGKAKAIAWHRDSDLTKQIPVAMP